MSFSEADYLSAATRLAVPISHVKAIADVESAGETFWTVDGKQMVPVRLEAHWFGKLTGYRFNNSHPDLSSVDWNPELAATTRAGAWAQVHAAEALDRQAADQATSWGAFQVMGFNWSRDHYKSVDDLVSAVQSEWGQLDAFARYIEADPALLGALRSGDWSVVEKLYNGGGFNGVYAARLAAAAARHADGTTPIPRALRQGDKGSDVAELQKALGMPADGDFGPMTRAAVRGFQITHGLVADGIAGAMTRNALWPRTA